MKMDTYIGSFEIRDDWDKEVVMEVVERDEYRRWGDIQINKGDMVLDLGAHIGSFSRLAASLGANVVAFEPNPNNFKLLRENTWDLNVTTRRSAVGVSYEVNLLVDQDRNELHKVVDKPSKHTIKVPCVLLDDLISEYGHIDLLKMDIEGSEYPVLYESKKLDQVKQITMEWHYGSSKMAELIIYLENQGFTTVWLGGNGDFGKLQLKRL